MTKVLSVAERKALVEKAVKLEEDDPADCRMPAEFFEAMSDDDLRLFADDFSADEMAERERNSDWIEEMNEAQKEADRKAGVIRPPSPFETSLLRYAAKDTRTATERALGIPAQEPKPKD